MALLPVSAIYRFPALSTVMAVGLLNLAAVLVPFTNPACPVVDPAYVVKFPDVSSLQMR